MAIYITPLERIRILQRENARLRSLVGEPAAAEPVEMGAPFDEPIEPAPTLIEKTDDLEAAVGLIAEAII